MKTITKMLLILSVIAAITTTSCSKDKPIEVDLTTKVIGNYDGIYKEGRSDPYVSINNVDVEVTKVSESEIKIKLIVIPDLATAEFNATMKSDAAFTVPDFELNEGLMNGSGSIQNGNIFNLNLNAISTTNKITYTGEKK